MLLEVKSGTYVGSLPVRPPICMCLRPTPLPPPLYLHRPLLSELVKLAIPVKPRNHPSSSSSVGLVDPGGPRSIGVARPCQRGLTSQPEREQTSPQTVDPEVLGSLPIPRHMGSGSDFHGPKTPDDREDPRRRSDCDPGSCLKHLLELGPNPSVVTGGCPRHDDVDGCVSLHSVSSVSV